MIPGLRRWVRDPLEKGMVTHSSILAWELHGQRRLVGYSPWGCKESDKTERLTLSLLTQTTGAIGYHTSLLFVDV